MSIVVEGLSYIYMKGSPFEKKALDNVSLEIASGEFAAIIGHTGSGKSTLVQHFNGILKPGCGRVVIDNMDVSSKNLKQLRKKVGIVFQYPEHQLFEETVKRDISFGMRKLGFSEERIAGNLEWALNITGLNPDIVAKSPFELSGGQKRRVAIAGVLVMEPAILILDEPAAGLDPRGREEIYGFIEKFHRERGVTVVLVSHNMEDIVRYAKKVIVMNRGKVEMQGPVNQVFKNADRLEEIGLSAPQVTYLAKKLNSVIPAFNSDIFTIEDMKNEIVRIISKKKINSAN